MKGGKAELAALLKRVDPSLRLILLHGPDEAQALDIAGKLTVQLADPTDPMSRIDLSPEQLKSDPGRLADEAAAVSMFGGAKLIRVDGAGEDCAEAVDLLLKAPAAGNPVVMVAGAFKKGSPLLAQAEASPMAQAIIFYEATARDLEQVAAEAAQAIGMRLGRGVPALLVESSGGERGVLLREIEKIALYLDASPAAPQTAEIADLDAIGARFGEADFSTLVEALLSGDAQTADTQLRRQGVQGTAGIPALRAVIRQFWRLLELRAEVDAGSSPAAVIEAQGKRIFWKEKGTLTKQLSRWTTPAIRAALHRLLDAERAIKSSGSAGDVLAAQVMIGLLRRA